ncbi:hypothetical protein M3689_16890 [Alkalihalophilus marmarensis]|uniref:hypothetical protein n=1 Tax=Alkalihalophilus marmarensis TaxID=521377 RepID=UPI002041B2C6|nr:hypothetical protein [Alkalihalophilus marmarensis]MCM3490989.1 hypothetical protein [Alkalihalophilus marmarensis]
MSKSESEFTKVKREELEQLREKLKQTNDEKERKRLITKLSLIRERVIQGNKN